MTNPTALFTLKVCSLASVVDRIGLPTPERRMAVEQKEIQEKINELNILTAMGLCVVLICQFYLLGIFCGYRDNSLFHLLIVFFCMPLLVASLRIVSSPSRKQSRIVMVCFMVLCLVLMIWQTIETLMLL